jgi:uncharacterized protein YneF (UPF0154 family)
MAQEDVFEIKNEILTSNEKISSIDKRIDDVLVFGGIIVTLLLAINIGVFINVDKQVDKHLKDNFEVHKKKIMEYASEVEQAVGKIRTELELAQNLRRNFENDNTTPI